MHCNSRVVGRCFRTANITVVHSNWVCRHQNCNEPDRAKALLCSTPWSRCIHRLDSSIPGRSFAILMMRPEVKSNLECTGRKYKPSPNKELQQRGAETRPLLPEVRRFDPFGLAIPRWLRPRRASCASPSSIYIPYCRFLFKRA